MTRILSLFALCLTCSPVAADSYPFTEVAVYKTASNDWTSKYPVRFTFGYEWELKNNAAVSVEYMHVSNAERGWPVNTKEESFLDSVGIKFRKEWR